MQKKLKGVDGLNHEISYIINKYTAAEVDCYFSNEFAFYIGEDRVDYTLIETDRTARTFSHFINTIGGKCNDDFDNFTYSLLHEIGHYYTLEEMNDFLYFFSKFLEKIFFKLYKKFNSDTFYSFYYYLPHEIIASRYAIKCPCYDMMKNDIKKAILRFYAKNDLTAIS